MPAWIQLDARETRETSISALLIAHNRFAGGGFDVAFAADVADGLPGLGVIAGGDLLPVARRPARLLDPNDLTSDLFERAQFRTAVIETGTLFHLKGAIGPGGLTLGEFVRQQQSEHQLFPRRMRRQPRVYLKCDPQALHDQAAEPGASGPLLLAE